MNPKVNKWRDNGFKLYIIRAVIWLINDFDKDFRTRHNNPVRSSFYVIFVKKKKTFFFLDNIFHFFFQFKNCLISSVYIYYDAGMWM